jgi:hypothetical protein
MYENKGYDKKVYPKMVSNILNVMGGPTPIYIPLGFSSRKLEASMCAPTKEVFKEISLLIVN